MSTLKSNGNERNAALTARLGITREMILKDYRIVCESRKASIVGHREVMSGKAKFGIFGDGKELPQVAMAHFFKPGDWRSGYYRDQTLMFATEMCTLDQFFAQLYAHADVVSEPMSGGRTMNANFATRSIAADGTWVDLTAQRNSSADVSPTGSQMPRSVGLAYASKLFRQLDELKSFERLSHNGDEITFITIGNASTAEGLFWESLNAIGVLRCPAVITVYDDGYGISVRNESQIAKENISELVDGFRRPEGECCDGYDIYRVKGWDYPTLIDAYRKAADTARTEHMPSFIHVDELTQPQGHSTSGSHERYKSKERLAWEDAWDGIKKFREWILSEDLADGGELDEIEENARRTVENARKRAWEAYLSPNFQERQEVETILGRLYKHSNQAEKLQEIKTKLAGLPAPLLRDLSQAAHKIQNITRGEKTDQNIQKAREDLKAWQDKIEAIANERYHSDLYIEGSASARSIGEIKPIYSDNSPELYGFEVLNAAFEAAFRREPRFIAFGEDVGVMGDVNQGMRGMQDKFGPLRVSDTGIREATIIGQGIGMALRGLRPLAEVQYLDYLLYGLQIISDDLATLNWRTKGGQRAPLIVRTRGHRLEGIWHSGSPMAGIIHLSRGVYLLTPRDMTRAAGFYNTLLLAEEPAIVVEALNGYRLKERLPDNIGEMRLAVGVPEVLREGRDISLITYGSCCRIVMEAAQSLSHDGIDAEVIDVQTLLPFDIEGRVVEIAQKDQPDPIHRRRCARRGDCLPDARGPRKTRGLFLARFGAAHPDCQRTSPCLRFGRRLLVQAKR